MRPHFIITTLAGCSILHALPTAPPAKFRAQVLDDHLEIGYGLAIADVDGDGKSDIVLADAKETAWYQNPAWTKHHMTGPLTEKDHVCIAASDIDGDGKAEVAVGANWNPGDTNTSGAVFILSAPADRTTAWTATEQAHEPTVHRMQWVKPKNGAPFLAVLPLHGRGNVNGEGAGVRFLGYRPGADSSSTWETFVINDQLHITHNFENALWPGVDGASLLIASKEGVQLLKQESEAWKSVAMTTQSSGEVRLGKLPNGKRFIATIEPFHGKSLVVNPESEGLWSDKRVILDDTLNQGHALAAVDFLGLGFDQIIAGWREPDSNKQTGIRLYVPTADDGSAWTRHAVIDDGTMACEDFKVADLNGDGKPDIIASGRATKNLIIYWNGRE